MFDLTSSKLLILGLVALIVVGPKELPLLLRTIGKYVGLIRRHANDFRAQFDEAMRDQELANLKAEMEAVKRDVENTIHSTHRAVSDDVAAASKDIEQHIHAAQPKPMATHADLEPAVSGSDNAPSIKPHIETSNQPVFERPHQSDDALPAAKVGP